MVLPYERPKLFRSSWPSYGLEPEQADVNESPPRFVSNAEGDLLRAGDRGSPPYLYFRPQVLEKYLTTSGYSAFFHMRTWGTASGPGHHHIDVGINSKDLLTAFAPDIGKLTVREQQHWAHYSSLPDGEVCSEMWQTRMQLRPPHSPSVLDLIRNARTALAEAVRSRFGTDIYSDEDPLDRDAERMSIGPIREDPREAIDLAKPLYAWVIESMVIAGLRAALDAAAASYDKKHRQIVLLRTLLVSAAGMPESAARSLVAPLVGLNELRVESAHALDRGLAGPLQLIGINAGAGSPRAMWNQMVDAVAETLHGVARELHRSPSEGEASEA